VRDVAVTLTALAIGAGVYLSLDLAGLPQAVPVVRYTLPDGQKSSTSAWSGRVVPVKFWATGCAECIQEMPRTEALTRRATLHRRAGVHRLASANRAAVRRNL